MDDIKALVRWFTLELLQNSRLLPANPTYPPHPLNFKYPLFRSLSPKVDIKSLLEDNAKTGKAIAHIATGEKLIHILNYLAVKAEDPFGYSKILETLTEEDELSGSIIRDNNDNPIAIILSPNDKFKTKFIDYLTSMKGEISQKKALRLALASFLKTFSLTQNKTSYVDALVVTPYDEDYLLYSRVNPYFKELILAVLYRGSFAPNAVAVKTNRSSALIDMLKETEEHGRNLDKAALSFLKTLTNCLDFRLKTRNYMETCSSSIKIEPYLLYGSQFVSEKSDNREGLTHPRLLVVIRQDLLENISNMFALTFRICPYSVSMSTNSVVVGGSLIPSSDHLIEHSETITRLKVDVQDVDKILILASKCFVRFGVLAT